MLNADALRVVVSARVLDAAAGCGAAQDALIVSSSTEVCTLSSSVPGRRQVLKPLNLSADQEEPLRFRAEVLEDLCGFKKGQIVNVELDLFDVSRLGLSMAGRDPLWVDVSLSLGRH
jgi:hypothetical protein